MYNLSTRSNNNIFEWGIAYTILQDKSLDLLACKISNMYGVDSQNSLTIVLSTKVVVMALVVSYGASS